MSDERHSFTTALLFILCLYWCSVALRKPLALFWWRVASRMLHIIELGCIRRVTTVVAGTTTATTAVLTGLDVLRVRPCSH